LKSLNIGFYRAKAAAAQVLDVARSQALTNGRGTLIVLSPPTYEKGECSFEEFGDGRIRLRTRAVVERRARLQIKAGDAAIIFCDVSRRRVLSNGLELEVKVSGALTPEWDPRRAASIELSSEKGRVA
jgi:hypothetical protein